MTVERMIELLEIEKECVLRNASGECNRYCAGCDLLQDDTELHEMYTDAIALLKAQEPVEPTWKNGYPLCGECGFKLHWIIELKLNNCCPKCGKAVKWE